MREILTDVGPIVCVRVIRGVPIEPVMPPEENVDPIRRTDWALWACRPYVVRDRAGDGWTVRCLVSGWSPRTWETGLATAEDAAGEARRAFLPASMSPPDPADLDF